MNATGTTRKRTTLADLDKRVCARGRGKGQAQALGARLGADVLAQIDLLRGRGPHARKRGIMALVQPPTAKDGTPTMTSRAYDTGAPIVASLAYCDAFTAPPASGGDEWRSLAYGGDDDQTTTAFAVEAFEEQPAYTAAPAMPDYVAVPDLAPPAAPIELPVATALNLGQAEDGVLGLDLSSAAAGDREDAEQFEREIQALLSGKTTRPPAQPAQPEPAVPVAPPRAQDIFEQLGRNMTYATSFSLPPMELGRRMDAFEREIAVEEAADSRKTPRGNSLELSDADVIEGLGFGSGFSGSSAPPETVAPPVPPPAPAAPTSDGAPAVAAVPSQTDTAPAQPAAPTTDDTPLADNGRAKP